MAKKQIKELVIKVTSPGGQQASTEIKELSGAMSTALKASEGLNTSLKSGAKYMGQISVAYAAVTKSIESSVVAVKALNTALNGDTVKATKSINAYIDNIQLLSFYLQDGAEAAKKFQAALSTGEGPNSFIDRMDRMIGILEALEMTTFDTAAALKRMDVSMAWVAQNTGKTASRLKSTRDYISDLDVTVNRGNESLEEYARRLANNSTSAEGAGQSVNTFNNRLKNLNGTGSQSARSFSKLAFGMNPLVSTYAAIAVNVYALSEAFRILKDAASFTRLQEQTAQFSASLSGINVKALAKDMQELAGGALDASEALKQAVRGVSFGFSPKLMKELTEGARRASIALGRDFADSMDRVIRGISKGEVELLDELGIVTRLETAFKNYAAATGLAADKLTDSQRKQALAMEVTSQLTTMYSKKIDTAATSMEQLGVIASNTTMKLMQSVSSGAEPLAKSLVSLLKAFQPVSTTTSDAAESLKIYQKAIADGDVPQATVAMSEYLEMMEKSKKETREGTEENLKYVATQKEQQESLTSINRALAVAAIAASIYAVSLVNITKVKAALIVVQGAFTTASLLVSVAMGTMSAAALPASLTIGAVASACLLLVATAVAAGSAILALTRSMSNGTSIREEFVAIMTDMLDTVSEVTGITDFTASISGTTSEVQRLTPEMSKLVEVIKSSSGAEKERAENLLRFIKDSKESVTSISEITKSMKVQKTEMQQLGDAFAVWDKLPQGTAEYAKGLKDLEAIFSNFQNTDVISKNITFDNGKGLMEASRAIKTYSQFMKNMSDELPKFEQIKGIENSTKASSDLLDINVRLVSIKSMLTANETLNVHISEKLTEEQVKQLKTEQEILIAKQKSIVLSKDLEASIYRSSLGSEKALEAAKLAGASQSELLEIDKKRLKNERGLLAAKEAETMEVDRALEYLAIQQNTTKVVEERSRIQAARDSAYQMAVDNLESSYFLESESLTLKKAILEADKQKEGLTKAETEALDYQIAVLKNKLNITKQQEEVQRQIAALELQLSAQERRTDLATSNVARVKGLQEELALRKAILEAKKSEGKTSPEEIKAETQALDFDTSALEGKAKGAIFADAAKGFDAVASIDGLTDMQSAFSDSLGGLSSTYSAFLEQSKTGSSSFMDFLKGNTDALASTIGAGLQIAQSVFAEISASKVASIDLEIAAEQRRDGKSQESLAKIKKLQAQKIKEEAKAKKASIGMSTAAAVMQAMASIPPPANIAFAAAIRAMGMMQMGNVDKAANGQLAALNGASSNLSISGGDRNNNVDVSRNASAGELAYLSGAKGTGTSSNFTPGRSGFGTALAGTRITVGESGPEEITPLVPISVGPTTGGASTSVTFSPVFNLSSVDTEGMEGLLNKYSRQLFNSLETELNAKNMTLESLK